MTALRFKLFLTAFSVIVLVSAFTIAVNAPKIGDEVTAKTYRPGSRPEIDQAINQARVVFAEYKRLGWDFSKGPCLSNALLPGWVLDIAHSPREAIDDLVENQCLAFREGSARHFVEMDQEGRLIRAK